VEGASFVDRPSLKISIGLKVAVSSSSTMATSITTPPPIPGLSAAFHPTASSQARASYLATPESIKYSHINKVLDRRGPTSDEAFVGGQVVSDFGCLVFIIMEHS
jgi:hypothetical protein